MSKRKTPKLNDAEQEILLSLENAYAEDPSPECGRTYCDGEDEHATAMGLLEQGLLRKVEEGTFKQGRKKIPFIHFGLTDAGFKTAEALCA